MGSKKKSKKDLEITGSEGLGKIFMKNIKGSDIKKQLKKSNKDKKR